MTFAHAVTAEVTQAQANLVAQPHHDGSALFARDDSASWDARILEVYRRLIAARNTSHALRHGGLRWVHADDDVLVFLRESTEQTALVHRARAAHSSIEVSTRHLTGVAGVRTAYGRDLIQSGESVTLTADVPEVNIWTWPRA